MQEEPVTQQCRRSLCHPAMQEELSPSNAGAQDKDARAHSCFPHGSWTPADKKSLRLTAVPSKTGKIKVKHLGVGEVMEKTYFILPKEQIFSPLQSKRNGCGRNKRNRLPQPGDWQGQGWLIHRLQMVPEFLWVHCSWLECWFSSAFVVPVLTPSDQAESPQV